MVIRKMPFRLNRLYAAGAIVAIAAALIAWYVVHNRRLTSPQGMLACLPRSGAVTVYIDVDGLRRSGILDALAGSAAAEDPDYRKFTQGTGLDYRRDLAAVACAFSGRTSHMVLRGKFDWPRLRAYATAQGGKCNANSVCRTSASDGRYVSFYRLNSGMMALAVSTDEWSALDIAPRQSPDGTSLPQEPVWVSVSGPALQEISKLPTGTRSFISPLQAADNVVFSMGRAGDRFEIKLDVSCPSDTVASDIVSRLEGSTNLLRKMMARENMKPSPRDLSGVLVAGTFRREARRVYGAWPVQRDFMEALAGGKLN